MSAAQHMEWLSLIERTGPFLAVGVLNEAFPQGLEKVETTKRQRVRSAYDEWRDAVDDSDPQIDALHRQWVRLVLEEVLEYESEVLKASPQIPELRYHEPLTGAEVTPDFAVMSGDKVRILIKQYAPGANLSAPVSDESWAASPTEQMTVLCRALEVHVGLVTNGEQWAAVSAPRNGGNSSVGTWFARIWHQEPVTLQAFVSLLGVRRWFGPEGERFDTLLARSLEHQNEVTDTLGEQVRRAIEVLVQALDRADLDRNRGLLRDVSATQLYEAGLTVMMRLVVLLCAEERQLLLLDEPVYNECYAVSTLRSKLYNDKEHFGEDVLERRHDAWARLLAVFRAVFGGIEHETLRLPALGGSLFDPDRFPFLEGRAVGTRWRDVPAVPLPIDNRTVLMLLAALQVLEQKSGAQLLSYEALDVEQIGHVYEGLLERTVQRVSEPTLGVIGSKKVINPNIGLSELEEKRIKSNEQLLEFLKEKTGRSEPALKNALSSEVDEELYHRVLFSSGGDGALADRIKPFAYLLRSDSWGDLLVYKRNSFIVTVGAGRRETGTHYTPKSLTEPIVQYSLEPLVYSGPAEGKPREQWRLKGPDELLALKVCDMAMGSGAFLVQTCRWVADRLVEAWDAEEKAGRAISIEGVVLNQPGGTELLPRDKAERVLIARRLIASRCLYGVDINPMAVELAKVSLWLITMMKGRPFNFLDHALKSGDSLLGVSSLKQIENFSLRSGERQVTFATAHLFRYVEQAEQKRRELEDLPSNDHTQIETKNRLHAEAEAATADVKALADCLIALELRGLDGDAYEDARDAEAEKMQRLLKQDAGESTQNSKFKTKALREHANAQLRGRRPFHWPVEFPEVFQRDGFDAFIGNPPFKGGLRLETILGTDYRFFLVHRIGHGEVGVRGTGDLCAYFFLHICELLRTDGTAGLIATNTISQGDTRRLGLDQIAAKGFSIFRAISSRPWPGEAALEVAHVWLRKGNWDGECQLDDKPVGSISAFLTPSAGGSGTPYRLVTNLGKAFQGSNVLGLGFVLTPEEAKALISKNPRNREVIFPYLNGVDLNSRPDQSPSRWVINFKDRSLEAAEKYPDAMRIVRERVKPERDRLVGRNAMATRRGLNWWRFAGDAKFLYEAIRKHSRVLVFAQTSKTKYPAFVRPGWVYDQKTVVIALDSGGDFALLCSHIHYVWVHAHGSTLGTTQVYTPSDCFETFPFPSSTSGLNVLGEQYHDLRSQIMHARQEGLTSTYNRFHDLAEASADIARLRALHVEMDQAVAAAYGWRDLDLGHGFHATKQGERYTISESAGRNVLDRLLALNHQRYAEEVKAGLHEKKKGKGKRDGKAAHQKNLI
jgi:type I restriction-modification system DNA methylase subunit